MNMPVKHGTGLQGPDALEPSSEATNESISLVTRPRT